jgi:hypothetical protein
VRSGRDTKYWASAHTDSLREPREGKTFRTNAFAFEPAGVPRSLSKLSVPLRRGLRVAVEPTTHAKGSFCGRGRQAEGHTGSGLRGPSSSHATPAEGLRRNGSA